MIVNLILEEWKDVELEDKKILVEEHLDRCIEELDKDIVKASVFYIKKYLETNSACKIQEEFDRHGVVWFTRPEYHYLFGMDVRNMLRDLVCDDEDLPTKSWDDYWSSLIEVALGLRKVDGIQLENIP